MIEREPQEPSLKLPPELAEALHGPEYACVTVGTEQGTVIVIKAPAIEIQQVRGAIPVELRHQLFEHPSAPVIRLALRLFDDPEAPLAMETFINVRDPAQRADYEALAQQERLDLLFFDEHLQARLRKQISHSNAAVVPRVLAAAEERARHIPEATYNFNQAKAAIQEVTPL